MEAADVALLLTFGAVVSYFLNRLFRLRRLPSLGVALLPTGWILVALEGAMAERAVGAVKWTGVALGLFVLGLVLSADRHDGGTR